MRIQKDVGSTDLGQGIKAILSYSQEATANGCGQGLGITVRSSGLGGSGGGHIIYGDASGYSDGYGEGRGSGGGWGGGYGNGFGDG